MDHRGATSSRGSTSGGDATSGRRSPTVEVQRRCTAELRADELRAARELLDDAYGERFGDEDWEHALGGTHVLVLEDGELVGHAAVVERRLLHQGRRIRTGYVEALGVQADRRRRGYAAAAMGAVEEASTRPRTSARSPTAPGSKASTSGVDG